MREGGWLLCVESTEMWRTRAEREGQEVRVRASKLARPALRMVRFEV